MANVAHKNLTGTDLHEVKGASTATSGQVPIADGLGSAPFGKIGPSSLSPTGNPFGAGLLHVQDRQSSGVAAQSMSAGSWVTRVLNSTQVNEITSASLSSNQISLPAGTYYAMLRACWCRTGSTTVTCYMKMRLRNITAGSSLIVSPTNYQFYNNTSGLYNWANNETMNGRFTLGSTSTLELQMYLAGIASYFGGTSMGVGEDEVYSDVQIWKIA